MSAPLRHTASVPVFRRYLTRLAALVDLAHAAGDPEVFEARLAPDMLPFHVQVEVACNFALRAAFPLAGLPVPPYGDDPATRDGLQRRIDRVLSLLATLDPAAFATERTVHDTAGQARLALPADEFLFQYALPNFFFHAGAAYHILRQRGLPVGKAHYDGYHVYG